MINIRNDKQRKTAPGFLGEYLAMAREIIGDRTPSEEKYDTEVLKGLREGKSIRAALKQASTAYPDEALVVSDADLEDVKAHYEYLLRHEEMRRMLGK